ncbi:hypothetical protein NDU88_008300 [Pleurodeles waltl]|uniref:Uncharacterized protein n=1 Tax=Pleurodeles waltl TaxID=8319 RepID=A0AAV7RRX5_PLEWA|nr:hypothetical protein NDU88_008300 [Pleurodeles waltl]
MARPLNGPKYPGGLATMVTEAFTREPTTRDGPTAKQTETTSSNCHASEGAPRRQQPAEAGPALEELGLTSTDNKGLEHRLSGIIVFLLFGNFPTG